MKAICTTINYRPFEKGLSYNIIDIFENTYYDLYNKKDVTTAIYVIEDINNDCHKFSKYQFNQHFITIAELRKQKLEKIEMYE
jgi:hypothetical protein